MEVKAVAKDTGLSPKRMRPLVDMVRGKKVEEALNLLKFTPTPKAKFIAKLVRSAAANAENNFQMDPADLKIIRISVDDARSLRRFRPRSRGRVSPIWRHSSHITVVVAEQEG
ncbi:MAG TPA: 50S ribosomal protein L22 [Dehalococcoidales bacterium]|nr:50S ribosomal protein L22 [Dehalococcoidales bacterium]